MNKNRITASVTVMAFAGVILHAVAPQTQSPLPLNSDTPAHSTTAAKPAPETSSPAPAAAATAPAPASAPVSDSLLSEVKIYPSF